MFRAIRDLVRLRRGGLGALPPPPGADRVVLESLARTAFARRGVEVVPSGDGRLVAVDGEAYGLTNLAASLAEAPRRRWPALVERHVALVLEHEARPLPIALDDVRERLLPRLRWAADLAVVPDYAASPLPGVVELMAIDERDAIVELVDDAHLERLGGADLVRGLARANLLALPLPSLVNQVVIDDMIMFSLGDVGSHDETDAVVHTLVCDDYFAHSRLLVLPDVLTALGCPPSAYGTLVIAPARELVCAHRIVGASIGPAIDALIRLGAVCERASGGLSPEVFYLPPDALATALQVTSFDDDDMVRIDEDGTLADILEELGLEV